MKWFVTLCLATAMLVGCGKDYDEKIIGSWKMDYWMLYSPTGTYGDAIEDWIFNFHKGGRGVMLTPKTDPYDSTTVISSTDFEYRVDDEELHMSLHDFEHNHIEKLDDSKLILSQISYTAAGEQMVVFSFTKN